MLSQRLGLADRQRSQLKEVKAPNFHFVPTIHVHEDTDSVSLRLIPTQPFQLPVKAIAAVLIVSALLCIVLGFYQMSSLLVIGPLLAILTIFLSIHIDSSLRSSAESFGDLLNYCKRSGCVDALNGNIGPFHKHMISLTRTSGPDKGEVREFTVRMKSSRQDFADELIMTGYGESFREAIDAELRRFSYLTEVPLQFVNVSESVT